MDRDDGGAVVGPVLRCFLQVWGDDASSAAGGVGATPGEKGRGEGGWGLGELKFVVKKKIAAQKSSGFGFFGFWFLFLG